MARPVIEKGETAPRLQPAQLSKRVYLMNVPYDAHLTEIENLCKEFVKIDKVIVPRDKNDMPRGYAFVYLDERTKPYPGFLQVWSELMPDLLEEHRQLISMQKMSIPSSSY